jgi:hypothetical protein
MVRQLLPVKHPLGEIAMLALDLVVGEATLNVAILAAGDVGVRSLRPGGFLAIDIVIDMRRLERRMALQVGTPGEREARNGENDVSGGRGAARRA